MLGIRNLTFEDLEFIWKNVEGEKWMYLETGILRCYNLEPSGCFIAEVDSERVDHVFSFNYGNIGWIGLLIVCPEYRGSGIGTKLMQTAIKYLRKMNVKTIKLEAVVKTLSLYERLGFKIEFESYNKNKYCQ